MGLVQQVGRDIPAVCPSRVFEECVFEVGEAVGVQAVCVDGGVDDLEADQAHDLRGPRGLAHEEVEAWLPSVGPAPNLVDVLECLYL